MPVYYLLYLRLRSDANLVQLGNAAVLISQGEMLPSSKIRTTPACGFAESVICRRHFAGPMYIM